MKVNKLTESFCPDRLEQLDENLLVEGPIGDFFNGVKDKFTKKGPVDPKEAQKEADRKAREKADKKIEKRKKKQDPAFLGKDFHGQNSKSTFYIDNNYDKPMTQSQFTKWWDTAQQKIENMPVETPEDQKKKQAAEDKVYAQRYNAIVVSEHGRYMRRGAEPLEAKVITFIPGENDKIANGYFIEPYKYKKSGAVKKAGKNASMPTKQEISKFMTICETTGMTIVDSKGKQLNASDIRKIKLTDINNYKVKLGNVGVPIPDWIAKAKSKKLI